MRTVDFTVRIKPVARSRKLTCVPLVNPMQGPHVKVCQCGQIFAAFPEPQPTVYDAFVDAIRREGKAAMKRWDHAGAFVNQCSMTVVVLVPRPKNHYERETPGNPLKRSFSMALPTGYPIRTGETVLQALDGVVYAGKRLVIEPSFKTEYSENYGLTISVAEIVIKDQDGNHQGELF